ncbi:MAG: peptidylprolyl isomerase [Candidatus Aenigmarchaeota archaeon]|nr:peptidylprolyl isomerase [Candidatus Aenigmarchaeota archaeon]
MKKGDVVKIEYVGRLDSGEIFDLTNEDLAKKEKIFNPKARYSPVPVIVGANFILPGLDGELEKMDVNEEKEVVIEPQDAFGKRMPEMIKTLPLKSFKETPKPGTVVDFGEALGRVQAVSGGRVRVDFNHPLAGKRLHYKIKITGKIEGEKEKINAVLEFFGINADKIEVEGKAAKIFAPAPKQIKDRIADIIIKWIGLESVEFVERYEKKPESKQT